MSYSLSVSGHKGFELDDAVKAQEAARAFEEDVLEKFRAFVAEIEGCDYAAFSGGHIGQVDLLDNQASSGSDEATPAHEGS